MARERADHTLQPTALVHEVLIKILSNDRIDVRDEVGFKAWATKAIRHHLIDHVRRRSTATRGGGIPHLHLDEAGDLSETIRADRFGLLQMNEALQWLEEKHPRSAEVVRLRTFGGLDQRETSVRLGVPTYPIITRDGDTPDVARATRAYPTLWILAPDGTVLHEIVGMHDPLTLLTLLRAATMPDDDQRPSRS